MKRPADILARAGGTSERSRAGSGFTLVEMLIAVAAVGLIAVGLGKLFEKTGETVRLGRRISNLNEVAAMMERTMREDFSRMSRNGFLVIRHYVATDGVDSSNASAIGLTKDDPSPRARRVDEIVFFREGRFVSKRDPVNPARYPVGTAAQIYYGHGLPQDLQRNNGAYTPEVNDSNSGSDNLVSSSTFAPGFGQDGPSKYASNWILLRHETVLSPPQLTSLSTANNGAPPGVVDARLNNKWGDSKIQVGLQPAASDLFRIIAENDNFQLPNPSNLVRGTPIANQSVLQPRIESGIVDVAATDLSQVRARVLNAQPLEANYLQSIRSSRGPAPFALEYVNTRPGVTGGAYTRTALEPGQSVSFVTQNPQEIGLPYDASPTPTSPVPTVARMKQWMIQSFPAGAKPNDNDPARERRMRCEPSPPDLNGVVTGTQVYGTNASSGNEAFRRTDQTMLTSSNFIVGCTEFIVEWSFGARYASDPSDVRTQHVPVPLRGQLIWHGLPRTGDVDGDGNVARDEYLAHPYNSAEYTMKNATSGNYYAMQTQYYGGYTAPNTGRGFTRENGLSPLALHVFQSSLIHEPAPRLGEWNFPETTTFLNTELYSCFGYVDPTFGYIPPRDAPGNNGATPVTRRPGEPESVNWPWPKLIRVTVSLVEPSEPQKEQTYQFIFELPREGDQLPGT